jgi:hypothetical protein
MPLKKQTSEKVIYQVFALLLNDMEPEMLQIWLICLLPMANVTCRRLFHAVWETILLHLTVRRTIMPELESLFSKITRRFLIILEVSSRIYRM